MIKQLYRLSMGFRGKIVWCVFLGVSSVITSMVFIWNSKRIIDIATGASPGDFVNTVLITAACLLLHLSFQLAAHRISVLLQAAMTNRLREKLFAKLMYSRWNEAERFAKGDLMTRILQDNGEIVRLLSASLPRMVVLGVELVSAFIFLFLLSRGLAICILLITPFFLLLSKVFFRKMRHYSDRIKEQESLTNGLMQESISQRTILQTLEYTPYQHDKLKSLQESLYTFFSSRSRLTILSNGAVSGCFMIGYMIAFVWGSTRIMEGLISFGTMTAFLQLANKIQMPVLELIRLFPSVINTVSASHRIAELEALQQESTGISVNVEGELTLTLKQVSFGYPERDSIFEDLDMVFHPCTMTAITGETGVGKTTLIRMLLGLTFPQSGKILLSNNRREVEVSPDTRSNFIYVPQGNSLFGTSIRNNLLMGNPAATEDDLREALHLAVAEFVYALPEGLQTMLGEGGIGLSEGQAQRIAIARAMLRPGRILVLDEATSALDTQTEELFLQRLKKRMANRTVIFITHHPSLASYCDFRYHLEKQHHVKAMVIPI